MANKIKFKQGDSSLPSFSGGTINITRNERNIYLDAENGTRYLIGTGSEAYLNWGGKNHAGGFGPIDACLESSLGANRFAFLSPNRIKVEYSRDGGETWTEMTGIDAIKKAVTSVGYNSIYVGNRQDKGIDRTGDLLRYTFKTGGTDYAGLSSKSTYSTLNKFIIYLSTNGFANCWCTVEKRLQLDIDNDEDTWAIAANEVPVSGWGGWNVINVSVFTTYGNAPKTQYGEIRFTFGAKTAYSDTYSGLNVHKIYAYGGMGWVTPSYLAKNGHLYTWDSNQNATFPATVTATTFKGTLSGKATSASTADMATKATTATQLEWNEF